MYGRETLSIAAVCVSNKDRAAARIESCASYHLAHFKNAASTALELGHHESRITFAHYRELVKPKEAERYWNIMPTDIANTSRYRRGVKSTPSPSPDLYKSSNTHFFRSTTLPA